MCVRQRDGFLLRVDRVNLDGVVGVSPTENAGQPDIIGLFPAGGPIAIVGERCPAIAEIAVAGLGPPVEHFADLRSALVGPSRQLRRLIVEEQLDARVHIGVAKATRGHPTKLRYPLSFQVHLKNLAPNRFRQPFQDGRIGDWLCGGRIELPAPADPDFLVLAGPVHDRGVRRARVALVKLEGLRDLIGSAAEPNRRAGRQLWLLALELPDGVAGGFERLQRRRPRSRIGIVAVRRNVQLRRSAQCAGHHDRAYRQCETGLHGCFQFVSRG